MKTNEIIIQKITKKKNKYFILTSSDEYLIDEETIVSHGIYVNSTYSKKEFDQILDDDMTTQWFKKTLRYLAFQLRTEAEVYAYLRGKEIEVYRIEIILAKLRTLGYLDDARYIEQTIQSLIAKGKGKNVIFQKLIKKGITKETLATVEIPENLEVIVQIVDKLAKKNRKEPIQKQQQKIYSKLVRDGHSSNIIQRAFRAIDWFENTSETIKYDYNKLNNKYRQLHQKEKQAKIVMGLLRKGYTYLQVKSVVQMFNDTVEETLMDEDTSE